MANEPDGKVVYEVRADLSKIDSDLFAADRKVTQASEKTAKKQEDAQKNVVKTTKQANSDIAKDTEKTQKDISDTVKKESEKAAAHFKKNADEMSQSGRKAAEEVESSVSDISFIAAAHGASAAIDNSGKLVFLSVNESEEQVKKSDCIDFALTTLERFTVKGILLHVQDMLSTGSANIFINDDSKTAYDGEISEGVVETSCSFGSIEIAEALWGQLGGFSYNSCEFTRRGCGWTELGDIITAVDDMREKVLGKYISRNMIAQTVEWSFSAASGFMEHIVSKAESSEESADKLGSNRAINSSPSGNTEKIKFVKNDTDYGTVNIHDVDGKTGIALSMGKNAEWFGLLDGDGNKILEYVPVPSQGKITEPHRIKGDLWFYPVNESETDGIYFAYPFHDSNEAFDPAEIDDNSPLRDLINSSIYCLSEEYALKLRAAGFPRAQNAKVLDKSSWVLNGNSYGVSFGMFPIGAIGAGYDLHLAIGQLIKFCVNVLSNQTNTACLQA